MQENTALLVMDMQLSIIGNLKNEVATAVIRNAAKAIAATRNKGQSVIYVTAGFRKNAPEISPNNKFFFAGKEMFANAAPEQWMKIHPALMPLENEIVVTKRRLSAFTGSDLEVVLRAKGIQHLVLVGVSTGGVVLSTVRESADKDYRLTVLSDGCADPDEEVHRVLTTKIFPRQAEMMTVDRYCTEIA